jgi:fumarate hydratase class II
LSDSCLAFNDHCAAGIEPNRAVIARNLENNLMLVTALNRHIGYDGAARIAKKALHEGITLRQAGEQLKLLTPEQFDEWVQPLQMTRPE